jgi:hypothetical protein
MLKVTFRLYETAEHRYYRAYMRDDGTVFYNNSRSRKLAIWEPLHPSGEGFEIRDLKIEEGQAALSKEAQNG